MGASFLHAAIGRSKKLTLTEAQSQDRAEAEAASHQAGEAAKLVREAEKQTILDAHMPEFLTAVGALGFEPGTPAYKTFVSKFISKKKALGI